MGDRDDLRRIKEKGTRRSAAISILVSIAALALVFAFVPDRAEALRSLRSFSRERLGLCALLMVGAWISDTLRLYLLTRGVRKPVNPLVALKGIMAGNFLTLITPFLAGGRPALWRTQLRGSHCGRCGWRDCRPGRAGLPGDLGHGRAQQHER